MGNSRLRNFKKISRVIGVIYKMQSLFPKRILLSLYNTMILPHINYCILSWGRDCKDILLLQKKAVRNIYSADYRAHTQPLFKCLNILEVDDIYHLKILVFYHNVLTGKIPLYFHSFMPSVSTGNVRYPLRNPQLQLPKYKHEYIKLTCRYQLPHF